MPNIANAPEQDFMATPARRFKTLRLFQADIDERERRETLLTGTREAGFIVDFRLTPKGYDPTRPDGGFAITGYENGGARRVMPFVSDIEDAKALRDFLNDEMPPVELFEKALGRLADAFEELVDEAQLVPVARLYGRSGHRTHGRLGSRSSNEQTGGDEMIVGISGYAGSGKDTAAAALASLEGWRQDSLAAPLKAMALDINPWIRIEMGRFMRLQVIFEDCDRDWEKAKRFEGVREFLQRLGTEGVRKNLGESAWVDALCNRHGDARSVSMSDPTVPTTYNTVVADVRFPNEAEVCTKLLWIERPGVGPVNNHPSDAGLVRDLATHIIVNDGTIEDLHKKVREAVGV